MEATEPQGTQFWLEEDHKRLYSISIYPVNDKLLGQVFLRHLLEPINALTSKKNWRSFGLLYAIYYEIYYFVYSYDIIM